MDLHQLKIRSQSKCDRRYGLASTQNTVTEQVRQHWLQLKIRSQSKCDRRYALASTQNTVTEQVRQTLCTGFNSKYGHRASATDVMHWLQLKIRSQSKCDRRYALALTQNTVTEQVRQTLCTGFNSKYGHRASATDVMHWLQLKIRSQSKCDRRYALASTQNTVTEQVRQTLCTGYNSKYGHRASATDVMHWLQLKIRSQSKCDIRYALASTQNTVTEQVRQTLSIGFNSKYGHRASATDVKHWLQLKIRSQSKCDRRYVSGFNSKYGRRASVEYVMHLTSSNS